MTTDCSALLASLARTLGCEGLDLSACGPLPLPLGAVTVTLEYDADRQALLLSSHTGDLQQEYRAFGMRELLCACKATVLQSAASIGLGGEGVMLRKMLPVATLEAAYFLRAVQEFAAVADSLRAICAAGLHPPVERSNARDELHWIKG